MANNPQPPAIAAAVYDAVGVWVTELPITPEWVLRALERREQGPRRDGKWVVFDEDLSVTTVAALALRLPAYDPVAIHGSRIPVGAVRSVTAGLLTASHERRAALPVMHPGRVDVIGAGALVLRVIMDAFAIDEVVVSEHDILDGIALGLG